VTSKVEFEAASAVARTRIPPLDALRFVSILGIVYWHAALPYGSEFEWFGFTGKSSSVMDFLIWIIVGFNIQICFFVAGVLSARTLAARGLHEALKRRLKRLVPPLCATAILFNLFVATVVTAAQYHGNEPFAFLLRFFVEKFSLYHLWFIYYLALVSVVSLIAAWVAASYLSQRLRDRLKGVVSAVFGNPFGLIALAVPTALITFQINGVGNALLRDPSLVTSPIHTLIVNPWIFAYFGLFFWIGWTTDIQLKAFARRWPWLLLAGVALRAATVVLLASQNRSPLYCIAVDLVTATYTWSMLLGFLGLFARYCTKDTPTLRYAADAGYWVYLLHMFPLLAIQLVLYRLSLPVALSYLVLVATTTLVTFGFYEFVIRYSALGRWLDGERTRPLSGISAMFMRRAVPRAAQRP